LRLEDAQKVVVRPYITERTFEQIERENKLCFIVADDASKTQIASAVETLYEVAVTEVNTTRTLGGKRLLYASLRRVPRRSWQPS